MSYVQYFTVFETVVNHLTHWTMLQPNICVNDIYQEMQITNRQTSISHCSCIMRHHHAPCIIILIFIIIITNHHKSSPSSPTSSHHHDHEWSSCIIRHYTSLSIIMHLTNDVSPPFSGIPILDARCTLDASTPPDDAGHSMKDLWITPSSWWFQPHPEKYAPQIGSFP